MAKKKKMYKKGQKVLVPREIRKLIQSFITMREKLHVDSFNLIAEHFKLNEEEVKAGDQKWSVGVNREEWTAHVFYTKDGKDALVEGTEKVDMNEVIESIVRLDLSNKVQDLIVHAIRIGIRGLDNYLWTLDPQAWTVEILEERSLAHDMMDNIKDLAEAEGIDPDTLFADPSEEEAVAPVAVDEKKVN